MENNKVAYLQMIQEVISRLSNISPVIKGFSITIVMAAITITSSEIINNGLKWAFLIPILALGILDIYYLNLERKYRCLYDEVRTDTHPVDYSMNITSDINLNSASGCKVLKSKCIWLFHLPIILLYLISCFYNN